MTDRKIIPIQAPKQELFTTENQHVKLAEMFMANQEPAQHKQKNLTPVEIKYETTRSNRVALIVAPEWSDYAAPYALARLTALSKASGFATKAWDININCKNEGPREYWSGYADWKWVNPHYTEVVHPLIEPILLKYVEEIVAWGPTVIGFSVWYTNDACVTWLAKAFRERLPNVKIIFGGPQATQGLISDPDVADYIVRGEGEILFLKILEHLENPVGDCPTELVQSKDFRIDLDSMPPADYSDMDISLYSSNGISAEISRGCVANCQYCSETTFWKFRSRQGERVLDEVEIAYRNQNVQTVYFIDSLVNGNLKELRTFAQGLIDREIHITWTGYARINGKIDKEFWDLLKRSGAWGFAFGVESGSQNVLDLMKKSCKAEWIEQNFRDLGEVGMLSNFATWFTGFPGEQYTDVAQTMTMMWRLRNSGMGMLSSGTCGLNPDTPLNLERDKFNISNNDWCFAWHTSDGQNTLFNRFIRFKSANILIEHFRKHRTVRQYQEQCNYPHLESYYKLEYDPANWNDDVPFEYEFDYKIIPGGINIVADGIVNEIWPLLRVLWLAVGPYKLHLEFDPDRDRRDFGYISYPGNTHGLWATYDFEINADGVWNADFDIRMEAEHYRTGGVLRPTDFHLKWEHTDTWTRPLTST